VAVPPLPIQYSIEEAVAAAFGTSELEAGALAGHLSTHREGYGIVQIEIAQYVIEHTLKRCSFVAY
jgi:hypothetical protein